MGPRVLLVKPSHTTADGRLHRARRLPRPELTLPLLAALTPEAFDVMLVDEALEPVPFGDDFDLVGLTAHTRSAPRAYELADAFRRLGRTVVMGGPHVSFVPEEALEHCDAVLVGEAEGAWAGLLDDFVAGRLARTYGNDRPPDLAGIPSPRFELLDLRRYRTRMFPVQATRGCRHGCEFCSVWPFFAGTVRSRPLADVLRDIEAARRQGATRLFFVDENLIADREYALALFEALRPLRMPWAGQAAVELALDEELLDAAAESGCCFLEIGFESVRVHNLGRSGKRVGSLEDCARGLDSLQRRGIVVGASFIVGFDGDDPQIFDETLRFLDDAGAAILDAYILTPGPGSALAKRLSREGRITVRDWSSYGGEDVVFTPAAMTAAELRRGYWNLRRRFYAPKRILRRLARVPLRQAPTALFLNLNGWRKLRAAA